MTGLTFDPNFAWGAATASFQIEGATSEGGRRDSIWDAFCRVPGAVANGDDGSMACDHYHRYPEDVAILKDLGLKNYRFSTSWARIMPDGRTLNEEGLDFYDRLVDELLANGIAPWLTLYHWDLPQDLGELGGWTNRDVVDLFADYAEATFRRLGDRVTNWTTLNEPWCSSFLSYAGGEHAPGHTNPQEAIDAMHHLLLAHGRGMVRMRALAGEQHRLGITLNFTPGQPADVLNPADVDAARRWNGAGYRVFTDPLFRGTYPDDTLDDFRALGLTFEPNDKDLAEIHQPLDFLGVNFYNGARVLHDPQAIHEWTTPRGRAARTPYVGAEQVSVAPRNVPRTAMNWEVEAEDFRVLLEMVHREFTGPAGIPIYVTENGAAYEDEVDDGVVDDPDRCRYYHQHLTAVHQAISRGADVRGYFAWSLLDNFEWAFGYEKRFGIVHVNYETLQRIPKTSARMLGDVARSQELKPL